MKTLDRYIAAIFAKNIVVASFALTALFLFQSITSELFNKNFPATQIVIYNLLNIPVIFVQMTPPGVLLATVMTLAGLSRTNELTACFSLGFGLKRIVSLLLSIVIVVCCAVLVIQDRILPPAFKKRTSYYQREMMKRPDFFLDIKQDKIWYRSQNFIYNLQRFDRATKMIYGMSVYAFDSSFSLQTVYDAERAEFSSDGWKLLNGTITRFVDDDPFPKIEPFKVQVLQIAETPTDFQEIEREVDSLRLKELSKYIARMRHAGADTKGYEVRFHSKVSQSFIPIVMCILGVPFSLRGRREGSAAKDYGLCLAITFFYWLFYSIGLSLGTNGALPPMLAAWLPSFIFGILALVLVSRQRR